ncbi:MAG: early E1A protein [Lachnospiraceae bacterium]|nr:early E1A protein [Lachnospiraceae bacterium]
MQASGNGLPMQCVANLVRIVRGECTYDRVKGIDPTLIDRPEPIAAPLLIADTRWLIKTYEPRVNVDKIDLTELLAREGNFKFNIDAVVKG